MPKASAKSKDDATAQSARFIEAAREFGCDEFPDSFEAAVKKVARHKAVQDNLVEVLKPTQVQE